MSICRQALTEQWMWQMSTQNANKGWQATQINKTTVTVMKEGSTDKQRDKDNRYNNYIIAIDKLRLLTQRTESKS